MHLYELFKNFVNTAPKLTNRKADKERVNFIIVLYLKHYHTLVSSEAANLFYVKW